MPAIKGLVLEIDGDAAPARLLDLVTEVEILGRSGRSSRFTLRLEAGSISRLLRAVDDSLADALAPGREIEVSHLAGRRRSLIVHGVIDSTGLDLRSSGRDSVGAFVVQGHDLAYPLTQRESVRTFEAVSASQVAEQIAAEHGLGAEVDATSIESHHLQSGQTDWDFLTGLAVGSGRAIQVEGKKLLFKKSSGTSDATLTWGRGLVSFRPEVNVARQTAKVTVRGWDPDSKRAVKGGHTAGTGAGKGVVRQIGRRVVRSEAEADELAEAVADAVTRSSRRASGDLSPGLAELRPGSTIAVKGVGERLGGSYRLISVTHRLTPADGFATHFEAGEPEIAERAPSAVPSSPCGQPSVAVALVTDNRHPDGGRAGVRVSFPWLSDDDQSDWLRVATPMAGRERGLYCLPEIGDEVLVAFEHGDLGHPYVIGALWNGVDSPPETNQDGDNNIRVMLSRSGHRIVFDDTDGAERVEIEDRSGGHRVILDSAAGELLIESTGNLHLKADGDLHLEGDRVTINAGHDLELNGDRDISLIADKDIVASAKAKLDLSAEVTATVDGGAQAVIQGNLVKIN